MGLPLLWPHSDSDSSDGEPAGRSSTTTTTTTSPSTSRTAARRARINRLDHADRDDHSRDDHHRLDRQDQRERRRNLRRRESLRNAVWMRPMAPDAGASSSHTSPRGTSELAGLPLHIQARFQAMRARWQDERPDRPGQAAASAAAAAGRPSRHGPPNAARPDVADARSREAPAARASESTRQALPRWYQYQETQPSAAPSLGDESRARSRLPNNLTARFDRSPDAATHARPRVSYRTRHPDYSSAFLDAPAESAVAGGFGRLESHWTWLGDYYGTTTARTSPVSTAMSSRNADAPAPRTTSHGHGDGDDAHDIGAPTIEQPCDRDSEEDRRQASSRPGVSTYAPSPPPTRPSRSPAVDRAARADADMDTDADGDANVAASARYLPVPTPPAPNNPWAAPPPPPADDDLSDDELLVEREDTVALAYPEGFMYFPPDELEAEFAPVWDVADDGYRSSDHWDPNQPEPSESPRDRARMQRQVAEFFDKYDLSAEETRILAERCGMHYEPPWGAPERPVVSLFGPEAWFLLDHMEWLARDPGTPMSFFHALGSVGGGASITLA